MSVANRNKNDMLSRKYENTEPIIISRLLIGNGLTCIKTAKLVMWFASHVVVFISPSSLTKFTPAVDHVSVVLFSATHRCSNPSGAGVVSKVMLI